MHSTLNIRFCVVPDKRRGTVSLQNTDDRHELDEMGPEIDRWIRHLVMNNAKISDVRMKRLADWGKISQIRKHAENLSKGKVVASKRDKDMALIIGDMIDRMRMLVTKMEEETRQAAINSMSDTASHLTRDTLNDTPS